MRNSYIAVSPKILTLVGLADVKNINPMANTNMKMPILPIRRTVLVIVERIAMEAVGGRQAIKVVAPDRTFKIELPKSLICF